MVMYIQNALQAVGLHGAFRSPLLAGLNWDNAANCGSQSQNANNYRWNTNTNISAQFLADPGIRSTLTPKDYCEANSLAGVQ